MTKMIIGLSDLSVYKRLTYWLTY